MWPDATRRALTSTTPRVPAFKRVRGGIERLHRPSWIDQVSIVTFGSAEMLSPELQAQVAGEGARAVAQARRIDRLPRIAHLVKHGACDLGVMAPRPAVEVVRPDRGPDIVDDADFGVHVNRDSEHVLDIEDRDAVSPGLK